ncbi:MAG: hypothetical protein AAGK02_01705 [Pseudomonadota bacterium]
MEEIYDLLDDPEAIAPTALWSTFDVSFGSAFRTLDGRTDLNNGAMLHFARSQPHSPKIVRATEQLATRISTDPMRHYEDGPRIAYALGGDVALTNWLCTVQNAIGLAAFDNDYAAGWLSRLSEQSVSRVKEAWITSIRADDASSSEDSDAWRLAEAAFLANRIDLALALSAEDKCDVPARFERDQRVAFATKDAEWFRSALAALSWQPADISSPPARDRDTLAMAMLMIADGTLAPDAAITTRLRDYSLKTLKSDTSAIAKGDLLIALAQLDVLDGRLGEAERRLRTCQGVARTAGRARLLGRVLERTASVQLERRKFRRARKSAEDCRELSSRLGMKDLEILAFKRRIEVEMRRANWKAAYTQLNGLYARCDEGLPGHEAAAEMLALIESASTSDVA